MVPRPVVVVRDVDPVASRATLSAGRTGWSASERALRIVALGGTTCECSNGLRLARQDSNGRPASFTRQGQAELAHCIQDQYRAATGANITINSATRSSNQQAYAMYTSIYQRGGCAAVRRLYGGSGRGPYVDTMCQDAANIRGATSDPGERQARTIADWEQTIDQAAGLGSLFSQHQDGNSIDIDLNGINQTELNRAIASCGGQRNNEAGHAHVDAPRGASQAPVNGDDCDPDGDGQDDVGGGGPGGYGSGGGGGEGGDGD
jgi:hypothetical protein